MRAHTTQPSDVQLRTIGDVARICRVTPRTIRNYIQTGRLKCLRLGGGRTVRFTDEQISQFLNNQPGAQSEVAV